MAKTDARVSAGTPVIAFGRGGALETIVADPSGGRTGVFFDRQSVDSIQAAILLAMIPTLTIAQGVTMLHMLRDAYRHRGWLVRQG